MNKAKLASKFAEMANYALDKCPASFTMTVVRKCIALFEITRPDWYIIEVGPFLYRNRKEIESQNLEHFLNRNWEDQYEDWVIFGDNFPKKFEELLKTGLRHIDAREPGELYIIFMSMLKIYSQYALLCRQDA